MAGSNGKAKGDAAQAERHARRAKEKADAPARAGDRRRGLGRRPRGRLVARGAGPRLDGAPEVPLEPADGLLVPDGDRGLREAPRAARAADRHPLRRAVRVGRVDRRHPVVAPLRRRTPAARHRARRADGRAAASARYFRKMGVLPAAPDSIAGALAAGRDVALWPGGEIDSLRPWTDRDKAVLAGRTGFIRMAIQARRPDRPDRDGRRPGLDAGAGQGQAASPSALQLDKIARLKMFPIAVQAPWGLSPAMLPEIPLPTKIRTAFQDPVVLRASTPTARATTTTSTASTARSARSIQSGMDALARRRALPASSAERRSPRGAGAGRRLGQRRCRGPRRRRRPAPCGGSRRPAARRSSVSFSMRMRSFGTACLSTTTSSSWSTTSCSSSEMAGAVGGVAGVGVGDRLALDADLLALDRDGLGDLVLDDVLAQAGAAGLALGRADAQLLLGARHRVVGRRAVRMCRGRRRRRRAGPSRSAVSA